MVNLPYSDFESRYGSSAGISSKVYQMENAADPIKPSRNIDIIDMEEEIPQIFNIKTNSRNQTLPGSKFQSTANVLIEDKEKLETLSENSQKGG